MYDNGTGWEAWPKRVKVPYVKLYIIGSSILSRAGPEESCLN